MVRGDFLMKKENGIALATTLISVAVIVIAVSIIIFFAGWFTPDSKEKIVQKNINTIKSAISVMVSNYGNVNLYGSTIDEALDIHNTHSGNWYLLSEEDLKGMGIKDTENSYVVNYKDNIVMSLEQFYQTEYSESKQGLQALLKVVKELNLNSLNPLPGQSAEELLGISNDTIKKWYILYNQDLKNFDIIVDETKDDGYAVNYQEKIAMRLNDFLESEYAVNDISENAIISLIKSGTIKIGDYISYTPDSKTYTTSLNETGINGTETFQTENDLTWKILYADTLKNQVIITPASPVSAKEINFKSIIGYFNAPKVLNDLCSTLYSNESLKLTARSITLDDINNACSYSPLSGDVTRKAYYPYGSNETGNIDFNNSQYEKSVVSNKTHRFLSSDGGGKQTSENYNGYPYSYSTPDSILGPVYVTNTYYTYNINNYGSGVSQILNQRYTNCFLADTCTYVQDDKASFMLMTLNEDTVGADISRPLYESGGKYSNVSSHYRPVVVLPATIVIDSTDTSKDGSSPESAWNITLR